MDFSRSPASDHDGIGHAYAISQGQTIFAHALILNVSVKRDSVKRSGVAQETRLIEFDFEKQGF